MTNITLQSSAGSAPPGGNVAFSKSATSDNSPRTNSFLFKWKDPVTNKTSIYNYRIYAQVKKSDGSVGQEQLSLTQNEWEQHASQLMKATLVKVQNVATSALFNPNTIAHMEAESLMNGGITIKFEGKDQNGKAINETYKDKELLPAFQNNPDYVKTLGKNLIFEIQKLGPVIDNSLPAKQTPTPVSSQSQPHKPNPLRVEQPRGAAPPPPKNQSPLQVAPLLPAEIPHDNTFGSRLNAVVANLECPEIALTAENLVFAAKALQSLNEHPLPIMNDENGAPYQINYVRPLGSGPADTGFFNLQNFPDLSNMTSDVYIPLHVGAEDNLNHFTLLYRKEGRWHYYDSAAMANQECLVAALRRSVCGNKTIDIDIPDLENAPQKLKDDKINCGVYVLKKIADEQGPIGLFRGSLADTLRPSNYFFRLNFETQKYIEQLKLAKPLRTPIIEQVIPPANSAGHPSAAKIKIVDQTPYAYAHSLKSPEKPLLLLFKKPSFYADETIASTNMGTNSLEEPDLHIYISDIHCFRKPGKLFFEKDDPTRNQSIDAALLTPVKIDQSSFDTVSSSSGGGNLTKPILKDSVRDSLKNQIYSLLQLADQKSHIQIVIPEYPMDDTLNPNHKTVADQAIAEIYLAMLKEHFAHKAWTIVFASTAAEENTESGQRRNPHTNFFNGFDIFSDQPLSDLPVASLEMPSRTGQTWNKTRPPVTPPV